MNVTTLRRFEFSAARRLAGGKLHGNNFIGWLGVSGPIDAQTGMLINIVELKAALNEALDRYDHRLLNNQLGGTEPTTLNVARALWQALESLIPDVVSIASLELQEMEENSVQLTADEATEIWNGRFSAAHRTHAPRLSLEENQALYGICNNPAGHGHNYRVEISLPPGTAVPDNLLADFDHRNLSVDVDLFQGRNVVTETIAQVVARRVPAAKWVRVWETDDFYAEYVPAQDLYRLGRRYHFHAAHRLHSPALSAAENRSIFGKCNRPDPHGHTYVALVTVQGKLDPVTETAFDLGQLDQTVAAILDELDHTYLDVEVPAFKSHPSTGENISAYLYERFQSALGMALDKIQLWETPNNLFIAQQDQPNKETQNEYQWTSQERQLLPVN